MDPLDHSFACHRCPEIQRRRDGGLEVTMPRSAVKGKALGKIEANLVYVASPLNRETLNLPEKIE